MALVPRKEEIETMANAIKDEEDLEAVAKKAIKIGFALTQSRELWAIATSKHNVYGPFESEKAAYDALSKNSIPDVEIIEDIKGILKAGSIPTLNGQATVFRMKGPIAHVKRAAEIEHTNHLKVEHLCKTCEHSIYAHGIGGKPNCSVVGCSCKAVKKP